MQVDRLKEHSAKTSGVHGLTGGTGSGDMLKSVYDPNNDGIIGAYQLDLSSKANVSHSHAEADVTNLVTDLGNKQATLVSATNIKTINSASILGSGNLVVSGVTNIKQTEIDFGTTPVAEASFVIADADVLVGSQLIESVAYEAPTGKDLDEMEMDGLDLKFAPGSGQFTLYARGEDGYVADKFKVNYLVG